MLWEQNGMTADYGMTAEWASEGQAINQWQAVNSSGAAVSLVVNGSTNANEFRFLSADIIYEKALPV